MTYTTLETLNTIISKMDEKRMAYVRFGDGELMIMNGWKGRNGNHWNSPELTDEMIKAFQINNKNYLKAIAYNQTNEIGMTANSFKRFIYQDNLKKIIDKFEKEKYKYYHPTALHYQMVFFPKRFIKLIDIIRSKKVMFVAGSHLKPLINIFKVKYYIESPSTQAYYDKILYKKIKMNIDKVNVILFGIGIATKPFISRIWNEKYNVILLDMGSVLDAMVGINSRSWITEMNAKIKKFNTELFKKYK